MTLQPVKGKLLQRMDQSSIGKFTRSIIKYSYNTISTNIHKSKWTYNMDSLVMPGVRHLWCILVPSSVLAKAPPAWKTPVVDHPEGMAAVPAMCAPARMAAKHHADDLPRMTCLQRATEKKHEKGWKQCVLASLHHSIHCQSIDTVFSFPANHHALSTMLGNFQVRPL